METANLSPVLRSISSYIEISWLLSVLHDLCTRIYAQTSQNYEKETKPAKEWQKNQSEMGFISIIISIFAV